MEERQVRQINQHDLNLAGEPSNENNANKRKKKKYISRQINLEKSPGSLVLLDSTGDQIIQD